MESVNLRKPISRCQEGTKTNVRKKNKKEYRDVKKYNSGIAISPVLALDLQQSQYKKSVFLKSQISRL